MIKEFVPYQESLELKELGFDEPCICMYNSYEHLKGVIVGSIDGDYIKKDKWDERLPAPLYQQAFHWFRQKYNLWNMIYPRDGWNYTIQEIDNIPSVFGNSYHKTEMKTYEEAELACLRKLIEIVKKK